MEMRSYYSCYSTDDHVPSSKPLTFDKDTAISVAMQILREPNDFIGFVDKDGSTIQFIYDQSGKIWMEFPSPSEGGSYGQYIILDEVEFIVKGLSKTFTKCCAPNAEFKKW